MEDGKHRRSLQFRLHLQSHLLPRFSRFPRLFSNLLPPTPPHFYSLPHVFHLYPSPTTTNTYLIFRSNFFLFSLFPPLLFARLSSSGRRDHQVRSIPLLSLSLFLLPFFSPPPLSIDVAALYNHSEKSRSIRDPFAKAHLQTANGPTFRFPYSSTYSTYIEHYLLTGGIQPFCSWNFSPSSQLDLVAALFWTRARRRNKGIKGKPLCRPDSSHLGYVTDMVRRSFARKITGAIFDFLHFIEHASRVFGRIFQSKIYLSSRYLLFIHRNGRELLVDYLIDCTKRKVLSLKFNHFDRSIAPLLIIQIINYFRIYRINTNIYFYISVPTMHSVSIRHDNT